MKRSLSTLLVTLFLALPAWADVGHISHGNAMSHATMTTTLSEGQVKKIDKDQGRLTIKHGPLENLGMPAMTMVFRVQDASWLDRVKPDNRIRFLAEKVNGVLTVTTLEVVQP
ncbi:copper-binding protein [Thiobacillus thioparus]|uniref:copper-binding protein n=1 Tax=Thiobacillus thioparus TaxID=931 RepID=UPI00036ED810|nr:copper-binding protein [Thiobacillus thioparus]